MHKENKPLTGNICSAGSCVRKVLCKWHTCTKVEGHVLPSQSIIQGELRTGLHQNVVQILMDPLLMDHPLACLYPDKILSCCFSHHNMCPHHCIVLLDSSTSKI